MAHLLDVKGLNCPLPVLRARKAIRTVPPGEVLTVLATDPGAVEDFQAFCEAGNYQLLESSEAGGVFTFRIQTPS